MNPCALKVAAKSHATASTRRTTPKTGPIVLHGGGLLGRRRAHLLGFEHAIATERPAVASLVLVLQLLLTRAEISLNQ